MITVIEKGVMRGRCKHCNSLVQCDIDDFIKPKENKIFNYKYINCPICDSMMYEPIFNVATVEVIE